MSIVNVGNSLTLEDLIALEGESVHIDQIFPDGTATKVELTERIGPLLLGYDTVSTIAPHRANKPNYFERLEFSRSQLKKILARFAGAHLIDVDDPNFKKNFDTRLDLFMAEESDREAAGCPFCYNNLEQRAENSRGIHPDTRSESGHPIVSVTSISPFMDEHLVTVFATHIVQSYRFVDLLKVTYEDLENYFVSGAQIAQGYRDRGGVGMMDFTNLGDDAGNSVRHPHTHRGKIKSMEWYYRHSKRAAIFKSLNGEGVDAMDKLLKRIEDSPLFIFKNKQTFIYAAWAPMYDHHVEIVFNNPKGDNSGNVLDFDLEDLKTASRSLLAVFHGLGDLGVRAANFVTHQSSFTGEPKGYRMQAELAQRTGRYDGAYDVSRLGRVVHTMPEETAMALRRRFN